MADTLVRARLGRRVTIPRDEEEVVSLVAHLRQGEDGGDAASISDDEDGRVGVEGASAGVVQPGSDLPRPVLEESSGGSSTTATTPVGAQGDADADGGGTSSPSHCPTRPAVPPPPPVVLTKRVPVPSDPSPSSSSGASGADASSSSSNKRTPIIGRVSPGMGKRNERFKLTMRGVDEYSASSSSGEDSADEYSDYRNSDWVSSEDASEDGETVLPPIPAPSHTTGPPVYALCESTMRGYLRNAHNDPSQRAMAIKHLEDTTKCSHEKCLTYTATAEDPPLRWVLKRGWADVARAMLKCPVAASLEDVEACLRSIPAADPSGIVDAHTRSPQLGHHRSRSPSPSGRKRDHRRDKKDRRDKRDRRDRHLKGDKRDKHDKRSSPSSRRSSERSHTKRPHIPPLPTRDRESVYVVPKLPARDRQSVYIVPGDVWPSPASPAASLTPPTTTTTTTNTTVDECTRVQTAALALESLLSHTPALTLSRLLNERVGTAQDTLLACVVCACERLGTREAREQLSRTVAARAMGAGALVHIRFRTGETMLSACVCRNLPSLLSVVLEHALTQRSLASLLCAGTRAGDRVWEVAGRAVGKEDAHLREMIHIALTHMSPRARMRSFYHAYTPSASPTTSTMEQPLPPPHSDAHADDDDDDGDDDGDVDGTPPPSPSYSKDSFYSDALKSPSKTRRDTFFADTNQRPPPRGRVGMRKRSVSNPSKLSVPSSMRSATLQRTPRCKTPEGLRPEHHIDAADGDGGGGSARISSSSSSSASKKRGAWGKRTFAFRKRGGSSRSRRPLPSSMTSGARHHDDAESESGAPHPAHSPSQSGALAMDHEQPLVTQETNPLRLMMRHSSTTSDLDEQETHNNVHHQLDHHHAEANKEKEEKQKEKEEKQKEKEEKQKVKEKKDCATTPSPSGNDAAWERGKKRSTSNTGANDLREALHAMVGAANETMLLHLAMEMAAAQRKYASS